MTLAVQNRHHKSIVMSDDQHILMPEDSTLATGEYKVFTTGPWSGNFKVNEEEHGNTGQDTLVEFTVNDQGITIDVSYIAGYTVPVVSSTLPPSCSRSTTLTHHVRFVGASLTTIRTSHSSLDATST